MIKSEMVTIKITFKTKSYYEKLLDIELKVNELIDINSLDIQNGSSIKITAICDFCGKEKKISKKAYNAQTNFSNKFTCSKKCSILKTNETNLKKWGVENVFQNEYIKDKIKKVNLEKYGFDNPMKSTEIQNKVRDTSLNRYGVNWPSSSDFIKEKIKTTNLKLFGFNYPAQNIDILDKMKKTNLQKYGVDNFSKTDKFLKIISEKAFNRMSIKLKKYGKLLKIDNLESIMVCEKCGGEFKISNSIRNIRILNNENICSICNPFKQHHMQKEISAYIKTLCDNVIDEDRKILKNIELDIYLPELKLAFEFNGLYWHSELYKDKDYHLNKTIECEKSGIQLIHIWEDDWKFKQDIVKSIILNKLGRSEKIFARKCEIKEINDNSLIRDFLDKNHIQGFVGSKIKIGLFYQNELVSLMTFGNLRRALGQKPEAGTWELLRFCNKLNTSIVGGASKLFKYFINNYVVNKIISYSDNSISNGNLYKILGFKFASNSIPNYYYIINGIRYHRFNFRKDKLIKEGFDSSKTEDIIMKERGYLKIWNAGNKKWVFTC